MFVWLFGRMYRYGETARDPILKSASQVVGACRKQKTFKLIFSILNQDRICRKKIAQYFLNSGCLDFVVN